MNNLSIIMPCELSRLPLFLKTLEVYKSFGFPDGVRLEFLLVTRSNPMELLSSIPFNINDNFVLRIVDYDFDGEYINPAMALNLGIKYCMFDNVLITCPEVMPQSNVLQQLFNLPCGNYICQVIDQNHDGSLGMSLVNANFRSDNPGMYFMSCFRKEDIEFINGWDEDFMQGIAYEDDDFGHRFKRAGLKYEFHDEIVGIHQYHPRNELSDRWNTNNAKLLYNDNNDVIRPKHGLEFIKDE